MDLIYTGAARVAPRSFAAYLQCCKPRRYAQFFPICPFPSPHHHPNSSLTTHASKRNSHHQQIILNQTTIEQEQVQGPERGEYDDEGAQSEGEFPQDYQDEIILDDDEDFEGDIEAEDGNLYVGDGSAGGGISLAGTSWDKQALTLAEEVAMSFGGDLKIFAFKTSANCTISLRIEKLSIKYGSPSLADIEAFSSAYRVRLEEAELAGTIPKDISLEVSSPGLERVIRVPDDLERFKDLPMFVRYVDVNAVASTEPLKENEGVFKLVSFDPESRYCTWGIANVRANREKAGKGRPLSKKQREWRLQTPFDSLRLVRRYSEC